MERELLEKIERNACKNLREYAEDGFDGAEETKEVKNLLTICEMCGAKDTVGRAGDGYWAANGMYGDDGMGGNGLSRRSMRRSRTTGRYMSSERDEMLDKMDRLMRSGDLSPEEEREAKRFMQMLDKA